MKKVLFTLTALIAAGTLWLYGMQPSSQPVQVTITQGEKEIRISRDIALQMPTLKNLLEDMGEVTGTEQTIIPLPENAATLDAIETIASIISLIQDKPEFQRSDGVYIAQRIQPTIDEQLAQKSIQDINQIIRAANYLELSSSIINGVIRVVVKKKLDRDRNISVNNIIASVGLSTQAVEQLMPLYEKQYFLIKQGNIPELSILDYIALNGQPPIRIEDNLQTLNLGGKRLTSLEGLHTIENINTVQNLNLSSNQLTQLPAEVFQGLTQLQVLLLGNNQLTQLPAEVFQGLTHLGWLYLNNNQLTQLPAAIFQGLTQLQNLDLNNNKLQITAGQIRQQNNLMPNVNIAMGTQRTP